jgi:cytochrome c oxidase subunit 3
MDLSANMGKLVPYRSPRTSEEVSAYVGMIIFLGSWAMMFATLFFTYGGLRARANGWPPPGVPAIPLLLPTLNTIVIAASSATLQGGGMLLRRGHPERLAPSLLASWVLGSLFLVLQGVVWNDLYHRGLEPGSGPYGSVFYGLTWIHAAHVGVGLIALGWLTVQAYRKKYTPARHLSLRMWTMYWHFVGFVWGAIFVSVYVL